MEWQLLMHKAIALWYRTMASSNRAHAVLLVELRPPIRQGQSNCEILS